MIGKTVSHYKIVSKIGAGGMGEVYLAEDTELKRNVALKFLPPGYSTDPDVLTRFKREAQAAAALNHPNIITVHEVSMYEDRPFIVMEHIEGLPLGTFVRSKALALPAILDLTIQIADGLSKAHGAGITHRDLKPDNILIDEDGRPKILDFGLAKQAGVTKITQEASTLGTVYYMSPEQTRGEDVDPRSDLFSLGTVLYEMITAHHPFEGEHTSAIMYAITHTDPHPLSRYNNDATPELERIVSKLIAKDVAERYQSAADLVADLKRERRSSDTAIHTAAHSVQRPAQKKRGRMAVKTGVPIVAAIIALWVVFKPFSVEIAPDKTATASNNSLAVMYFENIVDPADEKRTGEIVANLLITALSDADQLRVVSSQRLYDILKGLNKEGARVIDRNTATQVATRANASSMLLGSILQSDPSIVITYQLVDVASGDVKDSRRVDGRPGETVFALVDRMTGGLKQGLALRDSPTQSDRPVAELTTSSTDAYRIYLEGVELKYKNYKAESSSAFQQVLAIDSTMAMAAFWMANPANVFLTEQQRYAYLRQAYRHRDKVTERDRHMISSLYEAVFGSMEGALSELNAIIDRSPDDKEAYYQLSGLYWQGIGDLEKAIDAAITTTTIDPNYKLGYNRQAYIYLAMMRYEDALAALDEYIRVAPDEPNPYDSQAEVYGLMGRLDDAVASYTRALEKDPTFKAAEFSRANMRTFLADFDVALAYYKSVENHPNPSLSSWARLGAPAIAAMQGRYRAALIALDDAIQKDEAAGFDGSQYADKFWFKAFLYAEMGDWEQCLTAADRAMEKDRLRGGKADESWDLMVELLARSGNYTAAESLLAANPLVLTSADTEERTSHRLAKGAILYERGDYDAACEQFDAAADAFPNFFNLYVRAMAYLRAGRSEKAAEYFRGVVHSYGFSRFEATIESTNIHYYAGVAYEEVGLRDDAIAEYQEFLGLMKDADPGNTIVDDAHARLENLRQGS